MTDKDSSASTRPASVKPASVKEDTKATAHPATPPAGQPAVDLIELSGIRARERQRLRAARRQLPAATVAALSHRIAQLAQPFLRDAGHLAGYLSYAGEVSVDELMQRCRKAGGKTYVPMIQDDQSMLFAQVNDDTPMQSNRFGIREPVTDVATHVTSDTLDTVLVPLVGFDGHCNRLGMGGGFYDRTFAHHLLSDSSSDGAAERARSAAHRPTLIGVAYEMQRLDSVFPDWWDVPLDIVITECGVRHRPS